MYQKGYLFFFLSSAVVLALAYFFQYHDHLDPCLLCIMQRLCFFGVMITAVVAWLHNAKRCGNLIYSSLLFFFSGVGIYYAGRQVWLQYLAPLQTSACPPSLKILLANFPLSDVLRLLFYGGGDCALVTWRFLGLSMAVWSLFIFSVFFLSVIYFFTKFFKR